MVRKDKCLLLWCCGNIHLIYHSCQWSSVNWSEIKRNSKGERGRGRWSRSDLALIEFCTDTGHIHLGSSVHLNPDITPEYKTSEAWKPASSVSEIRWSSFRHRPDFIFYFFCSKGAALCEAVVIICRAERTWAVEGERQQAKVRYLGGLTQLKNILVMRTIMQKCVFSTPSGWNMTVNACKVVSGRIRVHQQQENEC